MEIRLYSVSLYFITLQLAHSIAQFKIHALPLFKFKMAKSPSIHSDIRKNRRHNPLSDDITSAGPLRTKSNKRKANAGEEEDRYVDSRSSRKILRIGQDLVDEEQEEVDARAPNPAFAFESRLCGESEQDEDSQVEDEEAWGDEDNDIIDEVVCIKSILL